MEYDGTEQDPAVMFDGLKKKKKKKQAVESMEVEETPEPSDQPTESALENWEEPTAAIDAMFSDMKKKKKKKKTEEPEVI
jgi:hypothetical protein